MLKKEARWRPFSRRDFIRGASLGAAAVSVGPLTGCDVDSESYAWDEEADAVIVGSGSGLVGALAASLAGNRVLVLEKQPVVGGATGMSGGVIWIPNNPIMKAEGFQDTREDAITYVTAQAQGQASEEIIESFVDNGPRMVDFLDANTALEWKVTTLLIPVCDYQAEWPGGVARGRSIEPATEGSRFMLGADLLLPVIDAFENSGGRILRQTPAKRLLTRMLDDGRQEVLGVEAVQGGQTISIKAKKGVVLATGGYDWNPEMKRHFLRGPALQTIAPSGHTGDGILMAMAAGADLRNMNECWGSLVYKEDADKDRERGKGASLWAQMEKRSRGLVMVNRFGERFCNEAGDYDTLWRSFFAWDNFGPTGYRNLPAYFIGDRKVTFHAEAGVASANTLDALAAQLGIDAEGLAGTIAAFNEGAQSGVDPAYHRGETLYDRGGEENPSATLAPLDEPPFTGVEVAPATIGTCGGARINGNAQVLGPFGQVIPRLYAAGNNAGVGGPGAGYGGGGCTLGSALTFAYVAGQHLATLDAWDE